MSDLSRPWVELQKVLNLRAWYTFTPTFSNATIGTSSCRYTRIGDMYYVHWDFRIASVPGASSIIVTSTLPEGISVDMNSATNLGWGYSYNGAVYNLVIITSTGTPTTINIVRYNVANANTADLYYRCQAIVPRL